MQNEVQEESHSDGSTVGDVTIAPKEAIGTIFLGIVAVLLVVLLLRMQKQLAQQR